MVGVYFACDVGQAAVTQLDVGFVTDFEQTMVERKVLFKEAKRLRAFAVRLVKPDDVVFLVRFLERAWFCFLCDNSPL